MLKRKNVLVVLLLLMSLFVVGSVSADTIVGRGWLRAQGNGMAEMKGNVRTLQISGNGTLWYLDNGEEDIPVVIGHGRRIDHANGWVQFVGFRGSFSLSDADAVIVKLVGKDINLQVVGAGGVHLRGHGVYAYGNGEEVIHGNWADNGNDFNLE